MDGQVKQLEKNKKKLARHLNKQRAKHERSKKIYDKHIDKLLKQRTKLSRKQRAKQSRRIDRNYKKWQRGLKRIRRIARVRTALGLRAGVF